MRAEEGDVFMGGSAWLLPAFSFLSFSFFRGGGGFQLSKRWGSDLTGWPLMSHEYRGTTCLQSNAVNTESNAPPGITIHAPWLYLRGAKGSPPPLLDWFQWPLHLGPLRAPKKTHFLCRPINFVWLYSREAAKSLSHLAMWPISHTFPRLRNDRVFVCIHLFLHMCKPTPSSPLTLIWSHFPSVHTEGEKEEEGAKSSFISGQPELYPAKELDFIIRYERETDGNTYSDWCADIHCLHLLLCI